MFISAFTIARNTDQLYFPLRESICSALPVSDELIIALGECTPDDKTEQIIRSINDPKIKIIQRTWNPDLYLNGQIFAHETTFALNQCEGKWCLYLQADEVLHEDDLSLIVDACKKYEHDMEVDGFLFNYLHFWGDYEHLVETHGLIKHEIRVLRNHIGCYSYKDAVSFRKGANEKLRVVSIPARIFHYGYVRPPHIMGAKKKIQDEIHRGNSVVQDEVENRRYDYGRMGGLRKFNGSHPAVMQNWISRFNWANSLDYEQPKLFEQSEHKHLRSKYRLLTWLEKNFNNNEEIFGFKNYRLVKR